MITRRSFVNLGWLTLVSLMWGTQFPVYRHAADHMSDSALSFYSFLLAMLMLLPFLLRDYRLARRTGPAKMRGRRPVAVASWLLLGVALLPASIGLSWGVEHSSGSNGAILYLTIPILMLVLAIPLLGEHLSRIRVVTLLLALAGAFFVSRDDLVGGQFTMSTLLGNAAIFSGCLGSAFYNTYSKRMLAHYSEIEVLFYSYGVAALLCIVASLCIDRRHFYAVAAIPASTWLAIAALGGVIWGISMVLFLWLLKRADVGQVSVSLYQQSFFGVLLSALMLGERLRPAQVIGALMVAFATLFADFYHRQIAVAHETP